MATLDEVLREIRQRESGGRYNLSPRRNYMYAATGKRHSEASGAYQFQPATWREWAAKAGVDIRRYPEAYLAPPRVQDAVAGFAATHGDVNSTALWGASRPKGGYPTVDRESSATRGITMAYSDERSPSAASKAIKEHQRKLKALGYQVEINGKHDTATRVATRKAQVVAGVKPTGQVDQGTSNALDAAMADIGLSSGGHVRTPFGSMYDQPTPAPAAVGRTARSAGAGPALRTRPSAPASSAPTPSVPLPRQRPDRPDFGEAADATGAAPPATASEGFRQLIGQPPLTASQGFDQLIGQPPLTAGQGFAQITEPGAPEPADRGDSSTVGGTLADVAAPKGDRLHPGARQVPTTAVTGDTPDESGGRRTDTSVPLPRERPDTGTVTATRDMKTPGQLDPSMFSPTRLPGEDFLPYVDPVAAGTVPAGDRPMPLPRERPDFGPSDTVSGRPASIGQVLGGLVAGSSAEGAMPPPVPPEYMGQEDLASSAGGGFAGGSGGTASGAGGVGGEHGTPATGLPAGAHDAGLPAAEAETRGMHVGASDAADQSGRAAATSEGYVDAARAKEKEREVTGFGPGLSRIAAMADPNTGMSGASQAGASSANREAEQQAAIAAASQQQAQQTDSARQAAALQSAGGPAPMTTPTAGAFNDPALGFGGMEQGTIGQQLAAIAANQPMGQPTQIPLLGGFPG